MKSVSNAFKLSCDNDIIDSDFLIYVSKGKNGSTLCTLDNTDFIIQTMRLRGSSTSEQTISIGGVCASEFTMTLTRKGVNKLQSNNGLKKNYCLHVVQWNKVDDGSQSSESPIYNTDGSLNTSGKCDLGYYYISRIKNSDYACEITAYDGMIRFDKAIGANVLKYMKKNKKTISGWLDYFCTKLNNSYFSFSYSVSPSIVNSNLEVCISDDSEVDTYRQALGYISALACGFATFDNDGNLMIQTYNTDMSVESISDKRLYDYDFNSYVSRVTSFSTSVAGFDFSLDFKGDKGGSEEIEIEVSENPFLRGLQKYDSDTLDSHIDTALINIANSILGVCFYGCNVNIVQRPYLDLGDMVDVQRVVINDDGSLSSVTTTNIIICAYDYNFCSSMSLTSSGATGTSSSSSSGKLSSTPKEKPSSEKPSPEKPPTSTTDNRVDKLIETTELTKKNKKRVPVDFDMKIGVVEVDLGEIGHILSGEILGWNVGKDYLDNYIDDINLLNSFINQGSGLLISGIEISPNIDRSILDKYSKPKLIIDSRNFKEKSYIMRDYTVVNDIHTEFEESSITHNVSITGFDASGNITEINSIDRDLFGRVILEDSKGNVSYLNNYDIHGDISYESEWHVIGNEANFQTAKKKLDTTLNLSPYGFRLNYDKLVGDDIVDLHKDVKDNYIDNTSMYVDLTGLDYHGIKSLSFGYKLLDEDCVKYDVEDSSGDVGTLINCYYTNNFMSWSLTDRFSYDGWFRTNLDDDEKNGYCSVVDNIVSSVDPCNYVALNVPGISFSRSRDIDDLISFEGMPLLYIEYEIKEEYEKTIAGVAKKLNDVSDKADKNESNINNIKLDLSSINSSVSSLKKSVKSLKSKVSSLDTSVSGMKTSITTIDSKLNKIVAKDYDTQLSNINSSIKSMKTDIATIDSKLSKITQKDYDTQLSNINSSIESINTSLSQTDALISSLNTSVSNQSITISNLNSIVSSQAETIAGLTNKISDLESKLDSTKPSSSVVNMLTFSNENDISIGTSDAKVLSCDIDANAETKLLVNLSFIGNFNLNDVLSIKLVIDGVESSFVPKFQVFKGYCSYSISKSILTTASSGTSNLTIFASLLNSSGSFSSENFEINILGASSGSGGSGSGSGGSGSGSGGSTPQPPYNPNLEYSESIGLISVGVSEPISIQGVNSNIETSFI